MRSTVTVLPAGKTTMTLGQATDRFLRRDPFEPSTRLAYRRTLQILLDEFDGLRPVTAITSDDLDDLLTGRWGKAAATTFTGTAQPCCHCSDGPSSEAGPPATRRPAPRPARSASAPKTNTANGPIPPVMVEQLCRLPGIRGRDRLLWRLAYETWARAQGLPDRDSNTRQHPQNRALLQ